MGGTFQSDLDPIDGADSEEDLDQQRRAGRDDADLGKEEPQTSVFNTPEENDAREEGFDKEADE